ncbi:MAG: site-specific integrase [Actinomycetota bacterium]|nr:site-specific integrase [Actinomycetota bacterium]
MSPTTVQTYRRDLDRYVLPRFGADRIGRLRADEIENWLNDEVAAGIAPSSVHRHYRTLRRVLQVAVQKQRLLANPCDRVEPPRVPQREMTFLSSEQVVELAEAHSERFRALIYLAVDSGCAIASSSVSAVRGSICATARSGSPSSWSGWTRGSGCARSRRPAPR